MIPASVCQVRASLRPDRAIADSAERTISFDSFTIPDGRRQECVANRVKTVTDTNMNLALVMLSSGRVQRFNNQHLIARIESCCQWDRGGAVMFQYCGDCVFQCTVCRRPSGRPHSRVGCSIRETSPQCGSRYRCCRAGSALDQVSTPPKLAAVARKERVAEGVFPERMLQRFQEFRIRN